MKSTQAAMPWHANKVPAGEVYKTPDKVTLSDFFWYLLNPGHCAGLWKVYFSHYE